MIGPTHAQIKKYSHLDIPDLNLVVKRLGSSEFVSIDQLYHYFWNGSEAIRQVVYQYAKNKLVPEVFTQPLTRFQIAMLLYPHGIIGKIFSIALGNYGVSFYKRPAPVDIQTQDLMKDLIQIFKFIHSDVFSEQAYLTVNTQAGLCDAINKWKHDIARKGHVRKITDFYEINEIDKIYLHVYILRRLACQLQK